MRRPASRLPWSTTSSALPRLNRIGIPVRRLTTPPAHPETLWRGRFSIVGRVPRRFEWRWQPAFALHGRTAWPHTPPRLSCDSMLTPILPLARRRSSSLVSLDADNIHAQSARERPLPAAAAGAAAMQRARAGRRRRNGGVGGPGRSVGAMMGVCVRVCVGQYGLYGRPPRAAEMWCAGQLS